MILRTLSSRLRAVTALLAGAWLGVLTASPCHAAFVAPGISPIDRELDGPGTNVDDTCFWVNPANPGGALIFVVVKDSHFVEVFNLATGALVTTIPGFEHPGSCTVEGDLLLTTDRTAHQVTVHHLPDFAFQRTFGADMVRPEGIDVLTTLGGDALAYVTDSNDASVHVYQVATGMLVRAFPTGFGSGIESIHADDHYQRIYVPRGDGEDVRGIGVFAPEGTKVGEFGSTVFSNETEGLATYACGDGGYLVAAEKLTSASEFKVFDRASLRLLSSFRLEDGTGDFTNASDGLDLLQTPVPGFPNGALAACDGCGTLPDEMDVVSWDRIANVLRLDRCPNGLPPDCLATSCTQPILADADAVVVSAQADINFGTGPVLEAEQDGTNGMTQSLLRFTVSEVHGFIQQATLRLTVARQSGSDSDAGGVVYATTGDWNETEVTFASRPQEVGGPIAGSGAVTMAERVDFDVTSAVQGVGTYEFVVRSLSSNKVRYESRESALNPPLLLLSVRGGGQPDVHITAPHAGDRMLIGSRLVLAGTAHDPEDGNLAAQIQWSSSIDGPLGSGATLTVANLSIGQHVITAIATDRGGASGSATVTIDVTPRILTFSATADTSVVSDTPDAAFGSATELAIDASPLRQAFLRFQVEGLGPYEVEQARIRLTVSGSSGSESRSGGTVYAISDSTWSESAMTYNTRPTVDGPALASQGAVARSQVLEFDVTPALVSDGPHSFAIDTTTNDAVKYRSREASTGAPQLVVTLTSNRAPVVSIMTPGSGVAVDADTSVTFSGSAMDAEDGNLAGAVAWTSSLDGLLGTGGVLTVANLSPGNHAIVATVTDSGGRHGTASIALTVNAAPMEPVAPELHRIEAAADGYVASRLPRRAFGARKDLKLQKQRRAEMLGYVRFLVTGTAGMRIERATLVLTPRRGRGAATVFRAAETGWQEQSLTYPSRPAIEGTALGSGAPVKRGAAVELDVTPAVQGDGPVTFAVTTQRRPLDLYSREATRGRPVLVLLLRSAEAR